MCLRKLSLATLTLLTAGLALVSIAQILNGSVIVVNRHDIPWDAYFTFKTARPFLQSKGIAYPTVGSDKQLAAIDIGDIARPITVQIRRVSDQSIGSDAMVPNALERALLFEQDPSNTQGESYPGTVRWYTETHSPDGAKAAVHANINILDRGLSVTWVLRRSAGADSPTNGLTSEVIFNLSDHFVSGGISNLLGIVMRQSLQTPGVALTGIVTSSRPDFFAVSFSTAASEMARNVTLLKDDRWIDLPIVYTNGRRAVLAVDKGQSGEQVFADAFKAWGF